MGGTDRLLEGEDTARGGMPGVLDSGSDTMLRGRGGSRISPVSCPVWDTELVDGLMQETCRSNSVGQLCFDAIFEATRTMRQ